MAEWADLSKWNARRLNPFSGSWDPANWDTSRIDFDKLVAEAEVVVVRLGYGLSLDPCFTRYREALETRRALWAFYHFLRPSIPPSRQVAFCKANQPALPPAGMWEDLEDAEGTAGETFYQVCRAQLVGLEQAYGDEAGIYSRATFLDPLLAPALQRRLVGRKVWWAGYPGLLIPSGWAEADPPYHLHQYTDRRPWAGLPSPGDASRRNPAVPLSALLPGGVTPAPDGDGDRLRDEVGGLAARIRLLAGG